VSHDSGIVNELDEATHYVTCAARDFAANHAPGSGVGWFTDHDGWQGYEIVFVWPALIFQ
jgi:hypothetical protein